MKNGCMERKRLKKKKTNKKKTQLIFEGKSWFELNVNLHPAE